MRNDGRDNRTMRPIKITPDFLRGSGGSALIEIGNTRVICAAMLEDGVPQFLRGSGNGWLTAEYSMLPAATATRSPREASCGKIGGRTHEIQRLIGRSLRSVVNRKTYGEKTIHIDCDVIQADGGTRTASITGAFIALALLFEKLAHNPISLPGSLAILPPASLLPIEDYIAAISVGIIGGKVLLDLSYEEDVLAEVDANIVMTGKGDFVEVQATAEGARFSSKAFEEMLALASAGIREIIAIQKSIVGNVLKTSLES